jgi:glutaredoxin 3
MAHIEIYSTAICPYCVAAKTYLAGKGQKYVEIRVDLDPKRREEMLARSNMRRTVPQIFIDGTHVGGFDDLVALDRAGGLEPLLTRGSDSPASGTG